VSDGNDSRESAMTELDYIGMTKALKELVALCAKYDSIQLSFDQEMHRFNDMLGRGARLDAESQLIRHTATQISTKKIVQ
jgi:hypothetical protein